MPAGEPIKNELIQPRLTPSCHSTTTSAMPAPRQRLSVSRIERPGASQFSLLLPDWIVWV